MRKSLERILSPIILRLFGNHQTSEIKVPQMIKKSLAVLLGLLTCCGFCTSAFADVVFAVDDFSVTPGASGTFDVMINVPSGSESLFAYDAAIGVSPTTGFTFDSAVPVTGLGNFFDLSTATDSRVSDYVNSVAIPISGSTVMYQVNYTVAPSVAPGSTFSLTFDSNFTNASDASLGAIPKSFQNATVTAVPEPSAFYCLSAIGLLIGIGRFSKTLVCR